MVHAPTTLILSLLSSLPHALGAPPLPAKPVGCQQSTSLHSFIPFRIANDSAFLYGIKTAYTEYYPATIHTALRLVGFQPFNMNSSDACGWHKARAVHRTTTLPALGSNRGGVYWKYADMHWVAPANGTFTQPHHKPPHTGALPSNATLDSIAQILRNNEPAADVYLLTTICLAYLSAFLGVLLILHLLLQYMPVMPTEDPGVIELPVIKVGQLPQLTPTFAPSDTTTQPCPSDESTRPTHTSGQRTPPPRYSRRGPHELFDAADAAFRVKEGSQHQY
ncbi:hypothetical protein ACEQ8H_003047 [Pleosporales sp. CAS-2024a]